MNIFCVEKKILLKKVKIENYSFEYQYKFPTFALPKSFNVVNYFMMYAIVDIAGQQFKVEKDKKIFVHRLEGIEGSQVVFDKVMLIDNDKDIIVGEPVIEGARVSASVLSHLKGDKIQIFKKKRRKGYRKLNGHRQYFTEILIESIVEKGANKVVAKAVEPAKIVEAKTEVEETVKKAKPTVKAAEAKPKTVAKKPSKKETGDTPANKE